MDKNTLTGIALIFAILMAISYLNRPSEAELERRKFVQDSIRTEQIRIDSLEKIGVDPSQPSVNQTEQIVPDSIKQIQLAGAYGAFSPAATGTSEDIIIENDVLKITLDTKGARIKDVELKEYEKFERGENRKLTKVPLHLLEDEKNKFEFILPVSSAESQYVATSDLYFSSQNTSNSAILRASAGENRFLEFSYKLEPGSYMVDFDLRFVGLNTVLNRTIDKIDLNWVNFLDKLEKNPTYEASYSSVYFKEMEEDPSYCSCRKSATTDLNTPLKWVGHAQQFFNSTLIADDKFLEGQMLTEMLKSESEDLKLLASKVSLPYKHSADETFGMQFFIGPNKYKLLRSYDMDMEDMIPFGWSIFGWINRNIIRPLFNFLASFIGNYGIIILVLTVFVKLVLYPLTYKMLYSQAKMAALKPELAKIKEKLGEDDKQQLQVEQMKLYRETGVNPLGGCMPMILQMPIWFALYRFFPASIEFRQKGFLWADDLSAYDSIINFGTNLPLLGDHLSLFTILWAVTTILYAYYNSKHMDFSANPMMKYIQYFMPIMFVFFFNSFASGLTCYLVFSNLFNIAQTLITKRFIIDDDKILKEFEDARKNPKKRSSFQERLESAMKEQQAVKAKADMERAQKRKSERQKKKKK